VCPEGSWRGSDVEDRAIDSDHAVAEMKVGPSGIGMQVLVSNRHKLLR
jgi:hypothetical protein